MHIYRHIGVGQSRGTQSNLNRSTHYLSCNRFCNSTWTPTMSACFFTQILLFVEPTRQQPTKKENPIAITLASQPPVHLNSPTPQAITTTPGSIAGDAAAVEILPLLFGTVSPHHASRPKQHRKSADKVDAWPWRRRRFRLLYRRL